MMQSGRDHLPELLAPAGSPEALAAAIPSDMARYRSKLLPAITVLPGKNGSMGMGAAAIKNAMERAIGADIL